MFVDTGVTVVNFLLSLFVRRMRATLLAVYFVDFSA